MFVIIDASSTYMSSILLKVVVLVGFLATYPVVSFSMVFKIVSEVDSQKAGDPLLPWPVPKRYSPSVLAYSASD